MNPVVHRLFDQVFNLGDLADLPQILSPDCQTSTSFITKLPPGPAGFAPFVAMLRDTFGHLFLEINSPHEISSCGPDEHITLEFCLHGLHRGELFWIEPSGRTISLPGEYRARVRGGQIIEQHLELSVQALMQQLGVEPSRRTHGQQ